jgi:N-carbamoyl-L-amino-acid hydrolase
MLTLEQINAASVAEFTALLDGTYEHSPWIAESACGQRPVPPAWRAQARAGAGGAQRGRERQLALIRAHPELAGKAMVSNTLTAESTNEQGKAGLTDCTPRSSRASSSSTPLQRQVRLALHPGRARAARHRAVTKRDHRHL